MNRVWLTLKPGLASLVNLALVLSISQPLLAFPLSAQAATTIFSDGFESNNFSNWTSETGDWETQGGGHTGSKHAEVSDIDSGEDLLVKAVSTENYENITVSYWYKIIHDLESTDHLYIEWSDNGGSTWSTVEDHTDIADNGSWISNSIDLPASADHNSDFRLRFRVHLEEEDEESEKDEFWLDDVVIAGDSTNNDNEEEEEEEEPQQTDYAVYGLKYNDANANGTRDNGEEGLGGVTMKLYQDGDVASTTVTAWDGNFGFNNLELGEEYLICEELPAGWHQTDPTEDGGSTWRAEGRKKCKNNTWGYEVEISEPEAYSFEFGNVKGGLIMGIKYRDNNNNGERDEDEPNLADWTIRLYDSEGEEVAETKTTWDGYFTFDGLEPGTYTVCEVIPDNDDNWRQTDPTEEGGSSWRAEGRVFCETEDTWGYNFEIGWGDEEYSFAFGNVPGAILAGWKYNDANANGQRDGAFPTEEDGEKGITNHPIKLYKINDDEEWQLVDTTYTDPDLWAKGMYYFKGVEPGEYYICEEMPVVGEWAQTDPTAEGGSSWRAEGRIECPDGTWGYATGPVEWGDEEWSFDFGNYKAAAIRVTKIASPDQGDFKFTLTGPSDYEESENTNGSTESPLEFLNLLPGLYQLSEEMPEDWFESQDPYCTDGEVNNIEPGEINLISGAQIHCYFNNSQFGLITGRKFEDKDADGVSEAGEPGLAGWTINLYQLGEGEAGWSDMGSAVTLADGSFSFGNLLPGTYYACEEAQAGWTQSAPASGMTCPDEGTLAGEVVIEEGGSATANFGNWQAGGLSGFKWHDYNHDGVKDENEPKLANWVIYIDENGNDILDEGELSEVTNEDGYYTFSDLDAGQSYKIKEVNQDGWVLTYPETGEHNVVVISGETAASYNFGNHEGEIPVPDTEAPETIITSPNPATEWINSILISGTTTDNVAVASTTLSFALFGGEECGSYSEIITLGNLDLDAVFDWLYNWTPTDDGDYCIKANGVDTSGNEEHTAIVFPVKFKKVATTTPPVEEEEEENTGGGGGGSSRRTSTTTEEGGDNGTTTPPGVLGNLALLTLPAGAGEAGDYNPDDLVFTGTTTGTTTDVGTTTENILDQSGLLAALGNLPFSWWWLLLLILILLAGYAGYRYWQRRHHNQ